MSTQTDSSGRWTVRRHVNLFVDGDDVRVLQRSQTLLREGSVLHVLPSVAGG